jgi:hypothetical protein
MKIGILKSVVRPRSKTNYMFFTLKRVYNFALRGRIVSIIFYAKLMWKLLRSKRETLI